MASNERPGIEISQELTTTPTVTAAPTLVPVIIGICNQIVDALDSEGALNPDAKYPVEQYNQATMLVSQAEFPDPRDNIDEINVYEDSVGAALYFGGQLYNLKRGSHSSFGKAFLASKNLCTRASVISSVAQEDGGGVYPFDGTIGDVLTLAFNVVNPANLSNDIVVTLLGNLSAQEVVDEINDAAGKDVASVFTDAEVVPGSGLGKYGPAGYRYVQITSLTWGATSSVTLRQGTSALKVLFGSGFDDAKGYRVVGSGFRGQDDADGDLFTPWIEFYQGAYLESVGSAVPVDTTFPTPGMANVIWAGLVDLAGDFTADKATQQIFLGPSATIPLVQATSSTPGDQLWADGVQVGSGEIIKLEQYRFKLGSLNTALSTYNDQGVPTTRVYNTIEVNTLNHGDAFAPKYAYFVADGLVWGSITPAGVAAEITGTGGAGSVTPERQAIVQSTAAITFPINLASLTLIYEVVEDGVSLGEQVYTFTLGPFTTVAEVVLALAGQLEGVTVSSTADDRLVLSTTKSGADQSITIKPAGTANPLLEFSDTVATADTGKDTEYVELAEAVGELISIPIDADAGEIALTTLGITVTDSKGIHTLAAAAGVDLTAATDLGTLITLICDALNPALAMGPDLYDGGIKVATITSSGDTDLSGTLTVTSVEGGTGVNVLIDAADATDGFRWLGFHDNVGQNWAAITPNTVAYPVVPLLNGLVLTTSYVDATGTYSLTATLGAPEANALTPSALADLLNQNDALSGISTLLLLKRAVWYIGDDANGTLIVRTILGGTAVSLNLDALAGTAGIALGYVEGVNDTDTGAATPDNADADGGDTLLNTELGFWLDWNPYEYLVTFTTNSLSDAVDEINLAVGGAADVASESGGVIIMTSLLKGAASKVEIDDPTTAAVVLGLSGDAEGSGRPDPNFYLNGDGSVIIGPSILRNSTTGVPFSLESAFADLYIAYKGLRLDVSASAEDPGLATLGTQQLIEDAIGPISTDNPLALGAFLAKLNAPGVGISVLGLDEQNAAAPEGTLDAWARGLEFLESKEVYTLAPLTKDPYVTSLIALHAQTMSLPTNRGERIAFIWTEPPVTYPDLTVGSGTDGEANGTDDAITLDSNMSDEVIGAGITDLASIDVDEGLYLELLVAQGGATELRRYSVQQVNGVVLNFRTTFAGVENIDGFYCTTVFDGSSGLGNLDWTLKTRGGDLLVTGTSILDLNKVAEAASMEPEPYNTRRVYYLYAASIDVSVDGVVQNIPVYYAAAAIAGMVAQLAPQQPFTNVPVIGIGRVYGTDDTFSENQMDVIADGGRYLLVQQAGNVASRHSRSTATTSIEERELSITKSIDWLAKGLRATNRVFIGRYVITQGFLDQLTMSNQGFLDYAVQLGVVKRAQLKNILQDEDEPDTILIDVEAQPQYPSNKIRITIIA